MHWTDAMRALAAAHVTAVRERWSAGRGGTVHDAIDEILGGTEPDVGVANAAAAAHAAIAVDPRWQRIVRGLGTTAHEVEWLALLAACELDPRLTRVLGYLDDASLPAPPTPGIAARVWGWPLGLQPGPAGALARWQLAAPAGDAWQSTTPWTVDADVAAFLAGRDDWHELRRAAVPLDVDGMECLHADLLAELVAAVSADSAMGREVELVGPPGSGRRTLLAQLAAALGRHAVALEPDAGIRGLRTARLLDGVPVWAGDDALVGVDTEPNGLTLVARERPARSAPAGVLRLSWTMPATDAAQRRRLWTRLTGAAAPRVVSEWALTPADVRAGAAAGPDAATRVIRGRLRVGTTESMSQLDCPYDWDDLIVTERVDRQLHRLRSQVLLTRAVLDDWEFRRLCPSTAGVTALFAGPSGTGKTMAAQVLARSLDLDLFRVDLAEVVNKYIGETEKRLARGLRRGRAQRRADVLRRGRRAVRAADAGARRARPLREHRDRLPAPATRHLPRRRRAGDEPQERPRPGVPATAAHDRRVRRAGARRNGCGCGGSRCRSARRAASRSPACSITSGWRRISN